MRKFVICMWMLTLMSGIAYLFWHEDWKYSLPTPIPELYKEVALGTIVRMNEFSSNPDRPTFIHFFNPECPCSRFNLPHFKSLVRKYGSSIDFAVVVMNENRKMSEETLRSKFELEVPIYYEKSIANRCGVYSTPQAVLIGNDHK